MPANCLFKPCVSARYLLSCHISIRSYKDRTQTKQGNQAPACRPLSPISLLILMFSDLACSKHEDWFQTAPRRSSLRGFCSSLLEPGSLLFSPLRVYIYIGGGESGAVESVTTFRSYTGSLREVPINGRSLRARRPRWWNNREQGGESIMLMSDRAGIVCGQAVRVRRARERGIQQSSPFANEPTVMSVKFNRTGRETRGSTGGRETILLFGGSSQLLILN
ncbi:hypothetical protein BDW75DRAFT_70970 [Aspergillus navahoensis]